MRENSSGPWNATMTTNDSTKLPCNAAVGPSHANMPVLQGRLIFFMAAKFSSPGGPI